MSTGTLVSFGLDGHRYACSLEPVLEVVRSSGLRPVPGARRPLAGLLSLRGESLPVVEFRHEQVGGGDVLVVAHRGSAWLSGPEDGGPDEVGIAVDVVFGVHSQAELRPAVAGLPDYVLGTLVTTVDSDGETLVVELWGLLDALALLVG